MSDKITTCFFKTDNGRQNISFKKLVEYLNERSYFKEIENDKYKFYKKEGPFIFETGKQKILENLSLNLVDEKEEFNNCFIKNLGTLNQNGFFGSLNSFNKDMLTRDEKNKSFLFFKNCFVEISKDNIIPKKYTNEFVLRNENQYATINRDFDINKFKSSLIENKESIVYKFFSNITKDVDGENNPERFESFKTIVGYYLYSHKDVINSICYSFTDFNQNNLGGNGGTGKSLTANIINCYRNAIDIDCKSIGKENERFIFSNVKDTDNIVILNDLSFNFDINILFNAVTNTFTIESKNKNTLSIPFSKSPKLLITNNKAISIPNESSYVRRFKEFEFSNWYSKDFTPFTDFKKRIIEEFNEQDWFDCDMFFINCLKLFLNEGIKETTTVFTDKNRFISHGFKPITEYLVENLQSVQNFETMELINELKGVKYFNIHKLFATCKELDKRYTAQPSKFAKLIEEYFRIFWKKEINILKKKFTAYGNDSRNEVYCFEIGDLYDKKEDELPF